MKSLKTCAKRVGGQTLVCVRVCDVDGGGGGGGGGVRRGVRLASDANAPASSAGAPHGVTSLAAGAGWRASLCTTAAPTVSNRCDVNA